MSERTLPVVRTIADLRRAMGAWREGGGRVALVPTMGALHAGHLALVAHARTLAAHTVASLFVNPAQFGPHEDFSRYPRNEAEDAQKLAAAGCELLFAPDVAEIYPDGFATSVDPGALARRLEGEHRPGHFAGVATVVTKLLLQALPDFACFGEKDYQQLLVIRRIAADLDIPVRIEGVPTVRESDGLALSSRNRYLSEAERAIAPTLHSTLRTVARRARDGIGRAAEGHIALLAAGFTKVDYLEICDAVTLGPLENLDRPGRVLAAAWLGRTRLIDNIPLP